MENARSNPDEYGRKLGDLRATPAKRALRNDARKLGTDDALGEIVDNAIDNFAKQERLGRAADRLEIDITLSQQEITVRENSGGVTPEDLRAFVRVGARGVDVDAPRIGVWGAGQKLAVAALGNDVTISTRHWSPAAAYEVGGHRTNQVLLRLDESWWTDEDNWDVPVYVPDNELPAGETYYEIRKLNQEISAEAIDRIREELRDLYGDLLSTQVTQIRLNDTPIETRPWLTEQALAETFAFPPGFEPSHHRFGLVWRGPTYENGRPKEITRNLLMQIIVGLTARQDQARSGVYLFGVPMTESGAKLGPRKFVKNPLQDESVGYSSGPRSVLRKGHPTLGRLRIYVIFYGDSENIPWGMPGSAVKRGYNAANVFASQIRDRILQVARPYARFTAKAREIDLLPYSKLWEVMPEAERKMVIRRGAYLGPDDIDEADIKPKVRPLLRHQFRPRFLQWDHTKHTEDPPESSPAFDEAISKDLVGIITERDKRLKELDGDPVTAVDMLMGTLSQIEERASEGWAVDEEQDTTTRGDRTVPVTVRISRTRLKKLKAITGASSNGEAVLAAIDGVLGQENA